MFSRTGIIFSLIAAALLAGPVARAADPIRDIVDRPVPTMRDGTKIPIGEVQRALLQALVVHKFEASAVAPGRITARFGGRRESFEVEVHYTETHYSVRYRNSRRMDYDPKSQRIDESYNEKLAELGGQIQGQFEVVLQRMKRVAQKQTRRSLKV